MRRRIRFGIEALEGRALLATYTVTSTTDSSASGTLRWALTQANNTIGVADTIQFSIGSGTKTITLGSALPTIIDTVTINGTTQPGYAGTPIIELSGASLGSSGVGLSVLIGTTSLRGLVFNRFNSSAIRVDNGSGVVVKNCYVGTNVAGTAALANGTGINVQNGTSVIGGTTASDRNVIAGNVSGGIEIYAGSSHLITGNYIGLNATGTAAIPNQFGLFVFGPNVTIGGETAGSGNVISGNSLNGISAGAANLRIQGNRIGSNAAGTDVIPNAVTAINLSSVTSALIGGTATAPGGIPAGRNLIIPGMYGVTISGGSANSVLGNTFGLNAAGDEILFTSTNYALEVVNSSGNQIGSATNGAGNIFADFSTNVRLRGTSASNTVFGNQFGIPSGPVTTQLAGPGVLVEGSGANNRVGGLGAGERNIFLNLNGAGVKINNQTGGGSVSGNVIGNTATFSEVYSGMEVGVLVDGSANWTVEQNYLVGNLYGAKLLATTRAATNIRFKDNHIGGDASIVLGNDEDGLYVDLANGGSGNRVEFSAAPIGTIAHNVGAGVRVVRGSGIRITGQNIFDNAAGGIVLVAANNANNNQAAPTLTTATRSGTTTTVTGSLSGLVPNENYVVEFFTSTTNAGQGQTYIQSTTLTASAAGTLSLNVPLTSGALGSYITATATRDSTGDTSAFSNPMLVTSAPTNPVVTLAQFEFETNQAIRIRFDQNVSASLAASDLTIRNVATNVVYGNAFFLITTNGSGATTGLWTFFTTNALPDGQYTATLPAGSVTNASGLPLQIATTINFHVLIGDLNRDRAVNFTDLLTLAQNYGRTGKTFSQGNIDYSADGLVGFDDLLMLSQRYGTSLVVAAGAPIGRSKTRNDRQLQIEL